MAPNSAEHCKFFAEHCHAAAKEMKAMAAAHEEMAKSLHEVTVGGYSWLEEPRGGSLRKEFRCFAECVTISLR